MTKKDTDQDETEPHGPKIEALSANQQHQNLETYQQQQQPQPFSQQQLLQQQQAIASNNASQLSRKLPPLSTVYRTDYQPFTTFLPYEPAFREPPSQQQPQTGSSQNPNQSLNSEYQMPIKAAAEALKLNMQQPSLDSSINKFKTSKPKKSTTTTTNNPKTNSTTTTSENKKSDPLRPYACTIETCEWSFARQSDLTRHMKSHSPPQYPCPYWKNDPTCHKNNGSFNRLDVLKRHLKLVHYVKDKNPIITTEESSSDKKTKTSKNSNTTTIKNVDEPGWCRSCQKMFPNAKAFIEHCFECAENTQPAEWRDKKNLGNNSNYNGESSSNNSRNNGRGQQTTFRVILEPKAKKQKVE
ncbi:uncharacterized protein KGF55_000160 [Candida pseudojiufengensis]|uniref:uncharacterized protein n=1 Tax=Candida pseudojiufengensis TaxID=497109 RepID=UPI0022246A5A|nr:uncharacterized protein KGF55_000160 [Candida pseudojiufengensis]KAI5966751.1 hypothetical protein KGF55_000160 [Candida pseudojiufengensis]